MDLIRKNTFLSCPLKGEHNEREKLQCYSNERKAACIVLAILHYHFMGENKRMRSPIAAWKYFGIFGNSALKEHCICA